MKKDRKGNVGREKQEGKRKEKASNKREEGAGKEN